MWVRTRFLMIAGAVGIGFAAGSASACPFHGEGEWGDTYAYAGGAQRYSPFARGAQLATPPPAPPAASPTIDEPSATLGSDNGQSRQERVDGVDAQAPAGVDPARNAGQRSGENVGR
jgi:hypothetical protein